MFTKRTEDWRLRRIELFDGEDAPRRSSADGGRADVFRGLICLEKNTQPGMTETSLVPEIAAHAGLSFGELVRWMVEHVTPDR
jgi:hypothetical protein